MTAIAATSNPSLFKPLFIVAAVAFVLGFGACLVVTQANMAITAQTLAAAPGAEPASATATPADAPANDQWNLPKAI